MLKKIVEFVVNGEGTNQFEFMPDNFFYNKSFELVVVGKVTKGEPTTGDPVVLRSLIPGKEQVIRTKINRMEETKQERAKATEGMVIGMCLPGVRVRDLRLIRKTNKMRLPKN